MSKMTNDGLNVSVAANAILIAVFVNSGIKGIFFMGHWRPDPGAQSRLYVSGSHCRRFIDGYVALT